MSQAFLVKNKMTSDGLKINRNTELHLPCLNPFWASDPSSVNELNPEATMAPGSLLLPTFLCLTFHHPQAGLAPQFERMGELFLLLGESSKLDRLRFWHRLQKYTQTTSFSKLLSEDADLPNRRLGFSTAETCSLGSPSHSSQCSPVFSC